MDTNVQIWYSRLEDTALGNIWVAVTRRGLSAVRLGGSREQFAADLVRRLDAVAIEDQRQTAGAKAEIEQYLLGKRKVFSLGLDWTGMTAFQRQVLELTYQIPYGETVTYSDLARQIGRPSAARAVGRAEATNPIPLVVPCHRVVGSDGSLRGYAGPAGVQTKAWLLHLERSNV